MTDIPRLHLRETAEGVQVVVPYLPTTIKAEEMESSLRDLVDELVFEEELTNMTLWYYTAMALSFSRHLEASTVIFDCMDELSLFKGAPQSLLDMEAELLTRADVVYTGGHSLYEARKNSHHNIHPFPSSIDFQHFSQGRLELAQPEDQKHIPHPRLGFYGVIDERFNIDLLAEMANLRPDYQFVIIGPVVKIDPETLPKNKNIHYLGRKDYHALPLYLAGWDCAIMPFALNDSTKFISPTKTPEFLAAGKPVVSTSIRDVINPYGKVKLVYIADTAAEFVKSAQKAMEEKASDKEWINRVDDFLSNNSWDLTFQKMAALEKDITRRTASSPVAAKPIPLSASGMI
ncbi:MAG TPA: glycosyltransferase [Bacteriovoracaceae bacterium]|nr:glycosyltransferase [Bacteriovoracaceae bacterium]